MHVDSSGTLLFHFVELCHKQSMKQDLASEKMTIKTLYRKRLVQIHPMKAFSNPNIKDWKVLTQVKLDLRQKSQYMTKGAESCLRLLFLYFIFVLLC